MTLTKAEKLGLFVRAMAQRNQVPKEGESDVAFAQRIIDRELLKTRNRFLKQTIEFQYAQENPPEQIDVSDL